MRKRIRVLGGGSSPRVRGTGQERADQDKPMRFIPACAGNRSMCNQPFPFLSVHPRVCGEQACFVVRYLHQIGSSPRVRGTGLFRRAVSASDRFIPACAGNRRGLQVRLPASSVHPRVCGEQVPFLDILSDRDGSSPRVRGTAKSAQGVSRPSRFIPACAGNSGDVSHRYLGPSVHPRVCGEQI